MEKKLILLAVASVISLSGCINTKAVPSNTMTAYERAILEERQRTNEVLSKAALLSSKSLAVYVRTKQALQQSELTSEQIRLARWKYAYIPTNMDQKISRSWVSAPEPLMLMLSSISQYELNFVNQRPPISKSVIVDDKKRNIRDFFLAIIQQTEGYIQDIQIDDKYDKKVITVIYSKF